MMKPLAVRAAWQREHPRVVPLIRALQIARTTALMSADERGPAARLALGYLEALRAGDAPLPGYVADLTRHLIWLARELAPDAIRSWADGPEALRRAPALLPAVLDAHAATGRFEALCRTAAGHGAIGHAAWLLAGHGRPFLALAML